MPNKSIKIMRDGGRKHCRVVCHFCKKVLMKKEADMHMCVRKYLNHFETPLGGSSVSLGTTNNSSLTNPLFGAPEDK